MYTRIVEITTKAGKARDLSSTIHEKVLPILRRQNGFVDEIMLVSQNNPNHIVALSFWNTKEDADQYQREQFSKVQEAIQQLVEANLVVQTYDVAVSTVHNIKVSKAA